MRQGAAVVSPVDIHLRQPSPEEPKKLNLDRGDIGPLLLDVL